MALTPEGSPYVESTDLVANYPAASLSLANRVDLVGVLPFATSAARATAIPSPTDGQYSYLQDFNQTEFWNGSAWVTAGGKILQVVRATDATNRSTTSATFVDASISVTITPQKSTSAVLLVNSLCAVAIGSGTGVSYQITDASNNAISGAQQTDFAGGGTNLATPVILMAYATPATTSPITYKLRFKIYGGTNQINNANSTGQMYAIEVSA